MYWIISYPGMTYTKSIAESRSKVTAGMKVMTLKRGDAGSRSHDKVTVWIKVMTLVEY